jgi:MFS transporter, DHA1 family, multidrug resistance protein
MLWYSRTEEESCWILLLIKDDLVYKLKPTAFSALALAFASFGDAFLYAFLPLNYEMVGVPLVWVGVLLSVNRIIRIVANGFIANLFEKHGFRQMVIFAVLVALFSTVGYAIASGIVAWIVLRICWGLSYSILRIGALGYALQQPKVGLGLGVSKSFQEAVPLVALLSVPLLLTFKNSHAIFLTLTLLSLPALYFSWFLPADDFLIHQGSKRKFLSFPSLTNSITLVFAIVIDGIMILVLGVLFLRYREGISLLMATSLAAFYLGYRRICLVVLSPLAGVIADKIGLGKTFNYSMIVVIIGLTLLSNGFIAAGAVVVFTFYGINAVVTPGKISGNRPDSLKAVAENATWRDIGAAVGTLLGGFLISSNQVNDFLFAGTILLTLLVIIYIVRSSGRPLK